MADRILLSVPHLGDEEERFVAEAFASNWITPLGPQVEAFEAEVAALAGTRAALATSSGTAAIHLALIHLGVGPGDEIFVSTLTFSGSVNPIRYCGATPVFIDSDERSWNMDPQCLEDALEDRARRGHLPKAVLPVHLYGQTVDLSSIAPICERYGVPLLEDAAEAMGTLHEGRQAGGQGRAGIFSFNGNKIITTGGGGMLVSNDTALVAHARKLSTQAREAAPHYEHTEIGYNYRMSNILAAVGRGQLKVLEARVQARRRIFERYVEGLGDLQGLHFMPEAPWNRHTRWLSTLSIDPGEAGTDREKIRLALDADGIEARPVWKPMHLQPVFAGHPAFGGDVSKKLFEEGLCLPSSSSLRIEQQERVIASFRRAFGAHRG